MPRALFEKTGRAVWISHLDLMRLFQRAFKRAGLHLTHTHGYNPRASVSIALPLSVGVESQCELLDFALDGQDVSMDEIRDRLNEALVDGVRIREIYDNGKKIGELSLLHCTVTLEYDSGVPQDALQAITALFERPSITVVKKTKSGPQDQDIIPMIRRLSVVQKSHTELELVALICCQNPTLNPAQLALAIEKYLPEYTPDFSKCKRLEIYDRNETVFR